LMRRGYRGKRKRMAMNRTEFTTEEAKANVKLRVRFGARFVAGAGEDRKAGIFGVGGIGGGALAEEERGALCGLDGASVKAGGTEAGGAVWALWIRRQRHVARIAF